MAENEDEQEKEPAGGPQNAIQLVITLDMMTGGVNVFGPLAEKGLCYQMLEQARDVVKDYVKKKPLLMTPPPGFSPLNGGGRPS